MASSRRPGPLGIGGSHVEIRDGTLVLQASPRPGPSKQIPPHAGGLAPSRPQKLKAAQLPVLRHGSRGPDVKKLQRLLNVRLMPGPDLDVDGIFGPKTGEAVRVFQRGAKIADDRVVGKVTWYHLLKGDAVAAAPGPSPPQAMPAPAKTIIAKPSTAGPKKSAIWEWPLRKKLEAAVARVPDHLAGRALRDWQAMTTPESLVLALLILVGFCLLSGGTAFVLGLFLLGADVGMSLAGALITAANASSEQDLDEAADELAHIVISIGVGAFLHGVNKAVSKVRNRGSSTESTSPKEGTPPPKPEGPVNDLKKIAPGKYESVPEKPTPPKPPPAEPTPSAIPSTPPPPSKKPHSRYEDGTIVYEGQQPGKVKGPATEGAEHSVLKWDEVNGRIYKAREYDANGHPVRDIDFTSPTDPKGNFRKDHALPPHQHKYEVNDPKAGPKSGFKRKEGEPLE